MINSPTIFEKLMQEHEVIQANTRQIASAADNLLTLFRLKDNPTAFTQYQVNILNDRRINLKRSISSLKDGLTEHYLREEELIQPLVGGPLMQIFKKEHQSILEKISEVDWILLNIGPLGILFNSAFLKQKIEAFCQTLKAICLREDSVLELLVKLPQN